MKNVIIGVIIGIVVLVGAAFGLYKVAIYQKENKPKQEQPLNIVVEDRYEEILLTAVGDCILGTDPNFSKKYNFDVVFERENQDHSYFFSGVADILANDDISLANLESVFTDYDVMVPKTYHFKGPAHYVNILKQGNVDIVNFANNHAFDYGETGYNDTIKVLNEANLPFYGYDYYYVYEIKGLKIGFAGIVAYDEIDEKDAEEATIKALDYLNSIDLNLRIVTFHWGLEGHPMYEKKQTNLAHLAIDNGADVVIGHHPHILQGLEEYKGKYIVYSLANFVFGGNNNPKDKDTMMFQEKFIFKNGILKDTKIKIIPTSISSKTGINDFKPIVLEGNEKTRVLNRILKISPGFTYEEGF